MEQFEMPEVQVVVLDEMEDIITDSTCPREII